MPDPIDALRSIPAPEGLTDGIEGWLLPDEEHALHALGATAPGPILEVGSWCGRSTVCLATGIATRAEPVDFTTVELNPGLDQWPSIDGKRYFRPSLDEDVLHEVGAGWNREIAPIVTAKGGILARLTANLSRAGVDHLVDVRTGDFRSIDLPHETFGTIFADVMHDETEVMRNGPHLARLARPGTLLACHDTTPVNRRLLDNWFRFARTRQIESLFVGRVGVVRPDGF